MAALTSDIPTHKDIARAMDELKLKLSDEPQAIKTQNHAQRGAKKRKRAHKENEQKRLKLGPGQNVSAMKYRENVEELQTENDFAQMPVASTGWQGINSKHDEAYYSKEDLIEQGFIYAKWNGM